MEKNNIQTAEDYELLYDLHTHTTYSHGKGSIEDNVREAFNQGLEFVAISDHGPGHLFYGINRNEIVNMRNDIERMNEMCIRDRLWTDLKSWIRNKFDFFLEINTFF